MAEEKVQDSFKEITQQEINLNFLIKLEQVQGMHIKYNKLIIKIQSNEGEINYQRLSPEEYTVHNILKNIAKLYNLANYSQNEKLIQGAKEEILKLIALLIWKVY